MSGGKSKTEKPKQDVFQAVVLADNFENYLFGENCPFVPECLMSLANRKMIDYSLEALTASGFDEIFVYSTRNSNELKQHIESSKWSNLLTSITVLTSEHSQTLGDVLRDLDAKSILRNDFILMKAGVVTNIALKPLLEKHRETVKLDKGAVMTLVHRKMSPGHRSRSKNINHIVTVDTKTGKIIAYNFKLSGKLSIPLESVQPEMELYMDTCDTGIAVCSSSVPPLFTDNFDFTNMDDFIRGIMINEEIMGNTLYLQRLETGYANCVVDFDTYKGISMDILQRWSYPLVPDMPLGASITASIYPFHYNFTYKGSGIKIGQGAVVGPLVLIGHNSEVGKTSTVVSSCLGDKCKVGRNVTIKNSFIGNNVVIEDDCQLHENVIADGTTLVSGTELKPWVLVNGKSQQRIELPNVEDDDEDSSDESEDKGGNGEEQDLSDVEREENVGILDMDFKMFSTEVMESLQRGFQEHVATENLVLEINSSKYAYNIAFKEVTIALTKGVLELVVKLNTDFIESPPKEKWPKIKETILKFKSLFQHYVKTEEAQNDLLTSLEEYANDHVYFRPLLMQTLHYLYDEDILFEDPILDWHKSDSLYEAGQELRNLVQQFVNWLKAAESDDDDED